jgi:beta-fructofuranosidase
MVVRTHPVDQLSRLRTVGDNEAAYITKRGKSFWFGCDTAFETFVLPGMLRNFRLRGTLEMEGLGKCGLVLRLDENGDGYYVSLELIKGLAQIRAWGNNPGGAIEEAFIYKPLQANYFVTSGLRAHRFELVAFGDYIELSIDDNILLSLADDTYREGSVGFYTESVMLRVDDMTLEELKVFEGETWGGTDE